MSEKHFETQPEVEENLLRWLTDVYLQVQKIRIGMGNRIWAVENERDLTDSEATEFRTQLYEQLHGAEGLVASQMEKALEGHPAWPWLQQVKGVGPVLAAQLLGLIGDIEKAPSISSLWRFSGLGVDENGQADRLKKGEKACYNKRLKVVLYKIGTSFLMCNSPYKEKIYNPAKEYYAANRDWVPIRTDYAARRKMLKIFEQHLWLKWREAVGLPVSQPWVIEHGGHVHYISPEDIVGGTNG
jgi:hypothetical protein